MSKNFCLYAISIYAVLSTAVIVAFYDGNCRLWESCHSKDVYYEFMEKQSTKKIDALEKELQLMRR